MSSHFFILTTQLNGKLGGLEFVVNEDGSIGYKKDGADTVYPFSSSLPYLINSASKYGTGNNAIIRATPKEIEGYELVLFGFQYLYLVGAPNNAYIEADNTKAYAGYSLWNTSISTTYGGYYVKQGTDYIIKDHNMLRIESGEYTDDVPGYKLVGAAIHISNYSSTNSSQTANSASISISINNSSNTVNANVSYLYSTATTTLKLLYLPE